MLVIWFFNLSFNRIWWREVNLRWVDNFEWIKLFFFFFWNCRVEFWPLIVKQDTKYYKIIFIQIWLACVMGTKIMKVKGFPKYTNSKINHGKNMLKSKSKHIIWKSKLRTWGVQNKVQTKFDFNNIWKCKCEMK